MLINAGTIIDDKLVLLEGEKGFTIPLQTQEKYKTIEQMFDLEFSLKGGSLVEADFKSEDRLMILLFTQESPITHFTSSLKCQLVRYSADRKNLLIAGFVNQGSTIQPKVNVFTMKEKTTWYTSYVIRYNTKTDNLELNVLDEKKTKSGNKVDSYMLINDRNMVISNTGINPKTIVIPPGITAAMIKKVLKCSFANVEIVTKDNVMKFAKSTEGEFLFYGYKESQIPELRVQSIMYNSKISRQKRENAAV